MEHVHLGTTSSRPNSPITTRSQLLARDYIEFGHYNMSPAAGTTEDPICVDGSLPPSPPPPESPPPR